LYVFPEWHIQSGSQVFNIRLQRIINAVRGTAFPPAKVHNLVAMEQNVLTQSVGVP